MFGRLSVYFYLGAGVFFSLGVSVVALFVLLACIILFFFVLSQLSLCRQLPVVYCCSDTTTIDDVHRKSSKHPQNNGRKNHQSHRRDYA